MVRVPRYPQGTRIVICRGRLPLEPEVVGRVGTIIRHDSDVEDRYAVQLDGESDLRLFAEDELCEKDRR